MAKMDCPDFEHSNLGTKEYWDNLYNVELANFAENGDQGEIWFGHSAELRLLKFFEQRNVPFFVSICDLGTGNGALLRKLRSRGFCSLVGLDYSTKAIELAVKQQTLLCPDQPNPIQFWVADLTSDHLDNAFCNKFDILIDKGTFDAISLCENREKCMKNYCHNIGKMFSNPEESPNRHHLLIISCNFTIDELTAHFVKMSSDPDAVGTFQFVSQLPDVPRPFEFGGKTGTTTNGAVFQWHPRHQ